MRRNLNSFRLLRSNFKSKNKLILVFLVLVIITTFEIVGYVLLKNLGYNSVEWQVSGNEFITDNLLEGCSYLSTVSPHPYLGYAHYPSSNCFSQGVNNSGFIGSEDPPLFKRSDFDVLVVGGSVAAQLAFGDYLKKSLSRVCQLETNVFNAADGAYKQPQQLIAMSLYSQGVDAVVSVEGFNEHYFFNDTSLDLEVPSSNYGWAISSIRNRALVNGVSSVRNFMQNTPVLSESRFFNFIFHVSVNQINNLVQKEFSANTQMYEFHNQSTYGIKKSNMLKYKDYLRQMNSIAMSRNQDLYVFIQPVPALKKILTSNEKKVTGNLNYADIYLDIKNELLELNSNEQGQFVYDLTGIYENVRIDIYGDPIHALQENERSLGYEIMAKNISETVCNKN